MDYRVTIAATPGTQDEREWELADEELDRSDDTRGPSICFSCSTSRPCTCSRCHCR